MTTDGSENNDIALAGEYALHLMDASQRADFEKRLLSEPALRDLLRDWDESFATLADDISDIEPPKQVWNAVEQTLFADTAAKRQSIWSWKFITGGIAVAAALAVVINVSGLLGTDTVIPEYTAQLSAEDQSMTLLASVDLDTSELVVTRDVGAVASGRAQELWLIPDGATVPISLGVLNTDAQTNVTLTAQNAALLNGATLAISDEPLGGSPTGLPTGAILAAGKLNNV